MTRCMVRPCFIKAQCISVIESNFKTRKQIIEQDKKDFMCLTDIQVQVSAGNLTWRNHFFLAKCQVFGGSFHDVKIGFFSMCKPKSSLVSPKIWSVQGPLSYDIKLTEGNRKGCFLQQRCFKSYLVIIFLCLFGYCNNLHSQLSLYMKCKIDVC